MPPIPEITDAEIAGIRENLPFGPPSPYHVMKLATELELYPVSVFRIWAGTTFKRRAAFPKDHPMRLNINAENARKQRSRDAIKKLDILTIGNAQNWICVYCATPLTGKHSPRTEGVRYHHDHIVPLEPRHPDVTPGKTEQSNIQLLCGKCNHRKNNMSDTEFRVALPRMQRSETRRQEWQQEQDCQCRYEGCYPDCAGCPLCLEHHSDENGNHPTDIICYVVTGIRSEFFDWAECDRPDTCRPARKCLALNDTNEFVNTLR